MSRSVASLPNAQRSGLSPSSGRLGRRQHVRQRLADVVHVGGAVATDVGEEARRRELRRHHRRARDGGWRPPADHGVGMEQRHREVAGVVGGQFEPVDQRFPGEQHHQVGHLDGLGLSAGSRREDHHERVVGTDFAVRGRRWLAGKQLRPFGPRGVEHGDTGKVEPVEQGPVFGVGQQELTVDFGDVTRQRLPATGGVDAAQHVAAQRSSRQRSQHLGGIAQQDADMQRAVTVCRPDQRGGLRLRRGDMFAPCPAAVAVFDRHGVLLGALAKQLLERVCHAALRINRFRDLSTMVHLADCMPRPLDRMR